jgi:hypothetical protein
MKTKNYLGRWVSCKHLYYKDEFQVINNLHQVHPDFQEFVKNNRTQTIYKCVEIMNEYLLLRSKKFDLKIKVDGIKDIYPNPAYEWGTNVQEIERPEVIGVIDDLIWHQNKNQFLYYLSIKGKKKSRQYYEYELKDITF